MLKLGIGDKALKTSFAYLLKRNWIKFEGLKDVMTSGGPQKVKSYSVVDIWNENISNYEGASKSDPLSVKVLSKEAKVLSKGDKGVRFQQTNKNPVIRTKEKPDTFLENTNTEENQLTQEQIKERIKKIREETVDKLSVNSLPTN